MYLMRQHKKLILIIVLVLILVGAGLWWLGSRHSKDNSEKAGTVSQIIDSITHPFGDTKTNEPPSFDKTKYSLTEPTSLWVIVNKQNSIPSTYEPAGLRQPSVPLRASGSSEMLMRDDAATAMEAMVNAAKTQGISLMIASAYRSYGLQTDVYNSEVSAYGQAYADTESARPGHSEHQTGLAADLEPASRNCEVDQCFANTPEGQWLAAHAHEYGFIIRYPEGKDAITGYKYEPWHVRYLGTDLSNEVYKSGQTLEEYFGLPAAPSY